MEDYNADADCEDFAAPLPAVAVDKAVTTWLSVREKCSVDGCRNQARKGVVCEKHWAQAYFPKKKDPAVKDAHTHIVVNALA